jgi:hypothetical protein
LFFNVIIAQGLNRTDYFVRFYAFVYVDRGSGDSKGRSFFFPRPLQGRVNMGIVFIFCFRAGNGVIPCQAYWGNVGTVMFGVEVCIYLVEIAGVSV